VSKAPVIPVTANGHLCYAWCFEIIKNNSCFIFTFVIFKIDVDVWIEEVLYSNIIWSLDGREKNSYETYANGSSKLLNCGGCSCTNGLFYFRRIRQMISHFDKELELLISEEAHLLKPLPLQLYYFSVVL